MKLTQYLLHNLGASLNIRSFIHIFLHSKVIPFFYHKRAVAIKLDNMCAK